MHGWVSIGFLAFFFVSLAVGVRLVLLWRRTRALPELLIGIGVLGIGPIGFGGMMLASLLVARGAAPADSLAPRALFALATATIYLGVLAKCVFNWRVYRPQAALPALVTGAIGLALVVLYAHAGVARGFAPARLVDGWTLAQSALQVGALLWGAGEALRYWQLMRRRLALGLADPVVTNRFLLWALGAGAAGIGTAIGTLASFATGRASLELDWVVASSSLHGLASALAMGLAVLPPRAYTAWIRARAGAPA